MVGFLVGSLVWSRLTDLWGRKWMIFGGLIFHIAILLILVIKVNPFTLIVFLFLLGFKAPLTISVVYLLLLEIVSPQRRAIITLFANVSESVATLILPLIFQFGKKWRILFWLNFGIATLLLLLFLFIIVESPKFLVSMRRFENAR